MKAVRPIPICEKCISVSGMMWLAAKRAYRCERRSCVLLLGKHEHSEDECRGDKHLDEDALRNTDVCLENRAGGVFVSRGSRGSIVRLT